MPACLTLSRAHILDRRRRATALDQRLPHSPGALQQAARAGLQDSMPRAALLSLHARVADVGPAHWEHPTLVQLWGPRFSAYVVAAADRAVFTLGRLPDSGAPLQRARDMAARLARALDGRRLPMGAAARLMGGGSANAMRYAAPTGTVVMRWDGARQPEIWNLPAPEIDPAVARLELARRHLQVFGPGTPQAFADWAGIRLPQAAAVYAALAKELVPVQTPIGPGWILACDEPLFRQAPGPAAPARLLPSGDTWFLLQGAERDLLLPDEHHRRALWTSRVWPGALLVDGETAGTWRRAGHLVTIQPWRRLSRTQRTAVEAEAAALPLPGIDRPIELRWDRG
jgi:hypothetical protein